MLDILSADTEQAHAWAGIRRSKHCAVACNAKASRSTNKTKYKAVKKEEEKKNNRGRER